MEFSRYKELKDKNAVTMQALGKGHFAVGVRKYDPYSREELEPELARCKREDVEAAIAAYEEALAGCRLMLADMDAAKGP